MFLQRGKSEVSTYHCPTTQGASIIINHCSLLCLVCLVCVLVIFHLMHLSAKFVIYRCGLCTNPRRWHNFTAGSRQQSERLKYVATWWYIHVYIYIHIFFLHVYTYTYVYTHTSTLCIHVSMCNAYIMYLHVNIPVHTHG